MNELKSHDFSPLHLLRLLNAAGRRRTGDKLSGSFAWRRGSGKQDVRKVCNKRNGPSDKFALKHKIKTNMLQPKRNLKQHNSNEIKSNQRNGHLLIAFIVHNCAYHSFMNCNLSDKWMVWSARKPERISQLSAFEI